MDLRELGNRVKGAISVLKGDNPAVSSAILPWDREFGKTLAGDYKQMVKSNIGWTYAAISVIGRSVAKVPLRLYAKRGSPKKERIIRRKELGMTERFDQVKFYKAQGYEVEEVKEHPFLELMKNVNPIMNAFELWELTQNYMDIMGNCYWYLVRNAVGIPKEIWVLMGQNIKIVPESQNLVAGYLYQLGNMANPIRFGKDEVIHFKYPHLSSLYYGYSPLEAAAYSVDSQKYQKRWEINLFKNAATPGITLETEKQMSATAYNRMKKQFDKTYRGVEKAGATLILEEGVKAKKLTLTPQELSFLEGRKLTREEILGIYGVPLTKLGFGETTNRATAEALDYTFAKETVLPRLVRLQEKINEQLICIYDAKLFVQFDNPIPRDKDYELKERAINIKNGVTTINEERQEMGLEEVPWGNVPLMPMNLYPVSSSPKPIEEGIKKIKTPDGDIREQKYQRWLKRQVVVEKEFTKTLKTYFHKQKNLILRNLEAILGQRSAGKKDVIDFVLFARSEADNELKKISGPMIRRALDRGIEFAIEDARVAVEFDVIRRQSEKWIVQRIDSFVQGVNEESAKKMGASLRTGLEAGESAGQLKERVERYYDFNEDYRSLRIARTESSEAMNEGIVNTYRSAGIEKKEWLTQAGCCEECDELNGTMVSVDGDFGDNVFGDAMQHPPLHPNCRCSVIASMEELGEL